MSDGINMDGTGAGAARRFVVMVHCPDVGPDCLDSFDCPAEAQRVAQSVVGQEVRYPVHVAGRCVDWDTAGIINGAWVTDTGAGEA